MSWDIWYTNLNAADGAGYPSEAYDFVKGLFEQYPEASFTLDFSDRWELDGFGRYRWTPEHGEQSFCLYEYLKTHLALE